MKPRFKIQDRLTEILLVVLCVLTFLIYYQGVNGPYVRDDYSNLIGNSALIIQDVNLDSIKAAAFSSPSSKYKRPVSMLSFAVNYSVAGNMQAYSVKLTNIILHIIIGIGIYLLTFALSSLLPGFQPCERKTSKLIALLTTAIWLLHPFNVSTVLYAVQRMAMLSTLFVVYGCLTYIWLRQRLINDNRFQTLIPVVIVVFTALAFYSKENGALLPGFLLLIEIFGFNFRYHHNTHRVFKYCLLFMLVVPTAYIFLYLGHSFVTTIDKDLPNYLFSAYERAITQPRILWQYIGWSLFLNPYPMSIIQDGIEVSQSLFHPATTIVAVLAWSLIIAIACLFFKSKHVLVFSLFWFLWGHIVESTVIPLAVAYEHRHYLPSIGILLALATTAAKFYESSNFNKLVKITILLTIFFVTPGTLLQERTSYWKDTKSLMQSLVARQADSAYVFAEVTNFLDRAGDGKGATLAVQQAQKLEPREPGFIVAETALHCTYYGEQQFSQELKDKLMELENYKKITVYFLYHFRLMVKSCAKSDTNHAFLLDYYNKIQAIANANLTNSLYYGIKIIENHRLKRLRSSD